MVKTNNFNDINISKVGNGFIITKQYADGEQAKRFDPHIAKDNREVLGLVKAFLEFIKSPKEIIKELESNPFSSFLENGGAKRLHREGTGKSKIKK